MSERAQHWEYFHDLYRFAVVLTGDDGKAMRVVSASLEDALKRPRSHGDLDRLHALLFKDVRERALRDAPGERTGRRRKVTILPGEVGLSIDVREVRREMHALPEPGRSALALLYLEVMETEELQRVLGKTEAEVADLLADARGRLHEALVGKVAGAAVE